MDSQSPQTQKYSDITPRFLGGKDLCELAKLWKDIATSEVRTNLMYYDRYIFLVNSDSVAPRPVEDNILLLKYIVKLTQLNRRYYYCYQDHPPPTPTQYS